MIVTIDGPAGAGKSTVARRLAAVLDIAYLDTGAMYRAIALRAIRARAPWDDQEWLTQLAEEAELQMECDRDGVRVRLDGEDVTEAIRTMEVNASTGRVARVPGVRTVLVRQQRQIGRRLGSLVTEGRDQGSVAFPDADIKFYMDADVEKRAERRLLELRADGEEVTLQHVLANVQERDRTDSERSTAPLTVPAGAIRMDTTNLSIAEVLDRVLDHLRRAGLLEPPLNKPAAPSSAPPIP